MLANLRLKWPQSRRHRRFQSCYCDLRPLKQNSNTQIFSCVEKQTRHECIVKIMSVDKLENGHAVGEAELLRTIQHGSIVGYRTHYVQNGHVYLVQDRCKGGDLFDALVQERFQEESEIKLIVRQILEGLDYLHNKLHYAHCDIKLSNIFLEDESQEPRVKIIDFGIAQRVDDEPLTEVMCSPSFVAPEVLSQDYNEKADLWSVGVVAFMLLFGFNPFNPRGSEDNARVCRRILNGFDPCTRQGVGAFFPAWSPASDEAKDLIEQLLLKDPAARPCASQALQHSWFSTLQ